jgi:WhiB family redox-sensing transcriptional regulator
MELMASFKLVDTDTKWMNDAKCHMDDGISWFPEVGQSRLVAVAKKFCGDCPVQKRCLQWAVDNEIPYGVWGGKSAYERRLSFVGRDRWGKIEP